MIHFELRLLLGQCIKQHMTRVTSVLRHEGDGWTDCEKGHHHFCVYFIEGIKIIKIKLKRERKKKDGDEFNSKGLTRDEITDCLL